MYISKCVNLFDCHCTYEFSEEKFMVVCPFLMLIGRYHLLGLILSSSTVIAEWEGASLPFNLAIQCQDPKMFWIC